MGAFESGQSFMAGVLAKLSPELRAQAETIFNDAAAKEAVTLAGDGALARSDYSRSMDTLREKEAALTEYYTRLDGWYKANESALSRAQELEAQARAGGQPAHGNGNGGQPPAAPGAGGQSPSGGTLTEEMVRTIARQAVNDAGPDYIALSSFLATQGDRHFHLFGEPLDLTEITANPKLGKPVMGQPGRIYSLDDAYKEKFGERLAAKAKEAEDKRINDLVEQRYQERLRSTPQSHPFPLRAESSPLDALATKEGPAAHTLDTAVAEYERLQQARGM